MVRVNQRLTGCRQTGKLLCLTILAAMIALAVGEAKGTLSKLNVTASESPEEFTTTSESPLIKKVTIEGEELVSLELGKAENESTPTPPFSNLWFNAGQSLGSAASSLTGWLNSRLVPQTTSTTTKPPEVIVRLQSNRGNRRPLIAIDQKKKTQANRINAQQNNEGDDEPENEDEDTENENEYEDNDEEEVSAQNSNKIRYPSNNVQDEEEDEDSDSNDENGGPPEEEEIGEDEDEDIVKPTKNRKNNRRKPNRPKPTNKRRRYEYEDDSDEYYSDYEDYDYDLPHKHSGRQQQQSFLNRIRQLAQNSYGSENKKPNRVIPTNKPNYRPVRILQNGQIIQLVEDSPNKQQANHRRKPSTNQNAFQLIPINYNQLQGVTQRPIRKRITKPDPASQFVISLSQNPSFVSQNGQKKPSHYITIPWSQLGISNPQEGSNQNIQTAAPILVSIPQQNLKRRRRPIQKPIQVVSAPSRKRLGQPIQFRTQTGQIISVLTDENLRDIFRMPEIPPSRTPPKKIASPVVVNNWKHPLGTNEQQSIEVTTSKPDVSIKPETVGEDEEDETPNEPEPFIVVGEDNSTDEALPRHGISKQFLQIGGMKPYIDVLNKGRFYIKSGRQLRMDTDKRPDTKVTSINPERTLFVGSDEIPAHDVTTDSSAITGDASKTTLSLGSDNTLTTRKLLTR